MFSHLTARHRQGHAGAERLEVVPVEVVVVVVVPVELVVVVLLPVEVVVVMEVVMGSAVVV